jgi:uncharacterized membrane protein
MTKLEQYLDQVCQSIGGPWALRQHVRQEMREHLLDAVAQHKAAGMSEEQALDQALTEFGKPDEVRSELESTYGKRTMFIIDNALEWKERTMRAKWLRATWAYLGLVSVIGLEVVFVAFYVVFIHPKMEKFIYDGLIDWPSLERDHSAGWMLNYLYNVSYVTSWHWPWVIISFLGFWGLFEWRMRSENKSFMRFAYLGTVAVGMMLVVMLTALCVVMPFCLMAPMNVHLALPYAIDRVENVETELELLEKAHAKKDWPATHEHAKRVSGYTRLLGFGPSPTSLSVLDPEKAEHLRSHVRGMEYTMKQVLQAIQDHDEQKLDTAVQDFRKNFEPVRDAAKKLKR